MNASWSQQNRRYPTLYAWIRRRLAPGHRADDAHAAPGAALMRGDGRLRKGRRPGCEGCRASAHRLRAGLARIKSTAPVTRRARVPGFFASSMASTYSRWWV